MGRRREGDGGSVVESEVGEIQKRQLINMSFPSFLHFLSSLRNRNSFNISLIHPKLKEGTSAIRLESLNKTVIVVFRERAPRPTFISHHYYKVQPKDQQWTKVQMDQSAVFKTDRNDYSIKHIRSKRLPFPKMFH